MRSGRNTSSPNCVSACMKITVIGAGHIGGTIGKKREAAGHDVVYGLRDPSKKAWAKAIAESLTGAERVLLAVPAGRLPKIVVEHAHPASCQTVLQCPHHIR